MRRRQFISNKIFFSLQLSLKLISQNHRTMTDKNSLGNTKQSTEDLFKETNQQIPVKIEPPKQPQKFYGVSCNGDGIFLTHQQKIQATYNFQSLFRKKSHIYNLHKNKKKLLNKNNKNQSSKNEDPDKESKNVKKGHWTPQQNRKYHWFLELHNKHFILKHLRRTDKIFKTMSSFIGSRQAQQCRSHHQKMQKKYKNFYQIIIKLRMQYYGTCNTDIVKNELEENGYIKQNKQLLIEQNILKSMQNSKDNQINSEKQVVKKQEQENGMAIDENEDEQMGNESQQSIEKQGNLFFGQNYQKQLNYKLY